jgi:hypothetical protein
MPLLSILIQLQEPTALGLLLVPFFGPSVITLPSFSHYSLGYPLGNELRLKQTLALLFIIKLSPLLFNFGLYMICIFEELIFRVLAALSLGKHPRFIAELGLEFVLLVKLLISLLLEGLETLGKLLLPTHAFLI